MAHESFESEEVAAVMNREFVNIKVDREERPDVDRVYMTFVQATTGGGGWPMSVWLTPDLKPFVGGTYFPPEDRYGQPGFKKVLERVATAWKENQGKIVEQGGKIVAALPVGGEPEGVELHPGGGVVHRRTSSPPRDHAAHRRRPLHAVDEVLGQLDAQSVRRADHHVRTAAGQFDRRIIDGPLPQAVWVGHDWGSPVVWSLASHHPERCFGVANLCVPYLAKGFAMGRV